MTSKLTYDDASMTLYFLDAKGDVERWCDWTKRKDVILSSIPELVDALQAKRVANNLMEVAEAKLREALDTLEDT